MSNKNVMEAANRRRSERVVLRVPVSLSAVVPDGKRVSIQAHSQVVNAHGGLLDVGMELVRGQEIRLNNIKTETSVAGRILRVEKSEEGRFLVAFEFESPAPGFWPVSFPPADWSLAEAAV
ncbi:MAG TPA: PilZ domain-containing protein [Candidatus Acidoferrum sp.]|nr:PilZ domain-containing protein [Candidatus Acidoferrum sp.]